LQILVALATTRASEGLGRMAINEALAHGDGITLLMVTEKAELERVYQLRCDPFFQGTRTLEDIVGNIELEHRRILEEEALRIEAEAAAAGIEVEKRLAVGNYREEILRETQKRRYRIVLWMRHARGFIARFFLGSYEDEIIRGEPDAEGVLQLPQET
jgi:nucleotide-binding universal stress UspA family protein